jgi:signal transduction histidine kinase
MPNPSLRVRIAATIACIVVAAVAILTLTVHFLMVQNRVAQERAAADANIVAAMGIYSSTGLRSFDAQLNDPRLPARLRSDLTHEGAHGTDVSGRSVRELWAAGRVGDNVLTIHTSFRAVDASVRAVDRALLLAGTGTAIAATIVGALSANRLSRRLRLAARTARGIASSATSTTSASGVLGKAGEQSLRAAVGPGSDEVGDLADAVDAMAGRLAARLRAEQRITADVAHDLRTPLTGLTTAAALLDDSRPSEMIRDRANALANLVEELLEIARLDSGVETAQLEWVRVSEVVDKAIQRGVAKGEFPPETVTIQTSDTTSTVLTDPRRLERVISNLVRNALQHGQTPIVVEAAGGRIVVSDAGQGFSAEFLATGPERFHRSSASRGGGHGLGLIIASGQTAVLGGRLRFDNAPSGGARVTIDLPSLPPGRETVKN